MEGRRDQIVILGSGNVATHLAKALDVVADVTQVWSRTFANALSLADELRQATPICRFEDLKKDADVYIIAVPDDAVASVASNLAEVSGIVAHTSGTCDLKCLRDGIGHGNVGIFYPLQTFSRNIPVDVSRIPFFIEGDNEETAAKLYSLANQISEKVFYADSTVRSKLHIAAVFACNFVNRLYAVADVFLKDNTDFDLTVLHPLMSETLRKAMDNGPEAAQTGPAVRGDLGTVTRHLKELDGTNKEIYELLTKSIITHYNPPENE